MLNQGIYKLINLENNKFYIGSAVNLNRRKSVHFHLLKYNKHFSNHLQNSYNKYGIENFVFEIIEYVEDRKNLIIREQFYLDTLKPHYNVCKKADSKLGFKFSEESKLKMSLAKKGKTMPWLDGIRGKNTKGRKMKPRDGKRVKVTSKIDGTIIYLSSVSKTAKYLKISISHTSLILSNKKRNLTNYFIEFDTNKPDFE